MLILSLLATGCVNTMFLPEGKALLRKEAVFKGNKHLDDEALINAIKTRPNRTFVIFPKAYLKVYNVGLLMQQDSSWMKKALLSRSTLNTYYEALLNIMLNKVGEKPKLLDSVRLDLDIENMKQVYFSRGYFNTEIDYEIKYKSRKFQPGMQAGITFHVREGEVYRIDSVKYEVDQPEVFAPLLRKAFEANLRPGSIYTEEKFKEERQRIAILVRNAGFYRFNLSSVSFIVDTVSIKNREPGPIQKRYEKPGVKFLDVIIKIPGNYNLYYVDTVQVSITRNDFLGAGIAAQSANPLISFRADTVSTDFRKRYGIRKRHVSDRIHLGLQVQQSEIHKLNYRFLNERILLKPGEVYSLLKVQRTQMRLQNMNVLRNNVMRFVADDTLHRVKVYMDMSLLRRNSIRIGAEAFTTEFRTLGNNNLPGVGGNITYRNNNVFRNAEKLEISTKGNVSFYRPDLDAGALQLYYAYGGRAALTFPRFVLPWHTSGDVSFFNPTTSVIMAYENENRIEFRRQTTDLSFTYQWYHIPFSLEQSSIITPLAISYINSVLSPDFEESIGQLSPFLSDLVQRDFKSRYTASHLYSFIFSDYGTTRTRSSHYFKGTFELGGLIPFVFDRYMNTDGDYRDGLLNSVAYGQFYKITMEGKRYTPLGAHGELVSRIKGGFADPINYVNQVPFESRYYIGGTNSLRGWISNTVGPGTFNPMNAMGARSSLINQGGEIMLESNIELRHDIYKYLEGAIFVDAGNVWFAKGSSFDDNRGKLSTQTFRLAADAGIGLRFDFSFLILRLDIAQQIYAPDMEDWVVKRFPRDLGSNRIQYNLGIGYPF